MIIIHKIKYDLNAFKYKYYIYERAILIFDTCGVFLTGGHFYCKDKNGFIFCEKWMFV